jgi:diacylglycerol kinase
MGVRHSLPKSFGFAFAGLKTAFRDEPNLRIHIGLGTVVIILAAFLGFSHLEWVILTFTIFFVIILELLNTVLEEIVNLVSPEIKGPAKIAKDVSAACVLVAALMSIIVGVVLFVPKIKFLL